MDRTTRLGAAVATALLLALAGCGGDTGSEADPAAPSSSGPTSAAPSESASASPSVAPATGRVMELPGATMRAPQGWSIEKQPMGELWEAQSPDATMALYFSQVQGSVASLDRLLEIGALSAFEGKPRLGYDAELGGEPAFRAVGRGALGDYVVYGGVLDGAAVDDAAGVIVEFSPFQSVPRREWQPVVDSVLASFEWR